MRKDKEALPPEKKVKMSDLSNVSKAELRNLLDQPKRFAFESYLIAGKPSLPSANTDCELS